MRRPVTLMCLIAGLSLILGGACGDEGGDEGGGAPSGSGGAAGGGGGGSPEFVGATCKAPADCFAGLNGTVKGEVLCLDRVRGGYCTHLCKTDADCCAVEGECKTSIRQVCSPFESTGKKMCFLSCAADDIKAANTDTTDDQLFCQKEASFDFICRSSGGGKENRKVCVPGDCGVGAGCGGDGDCRSDLTCLSSLRGGYCGVRDCKDDSGCPKDSRCVKHTDGFTYCMKTCTTSADCSFCRASTSVATCSDQVTFAADGSPTKVCVPPP
ncbi:MAG: hypothetical protein RMJ98_13085 [Myxococcales bacterium]|nr:hypothetical protein [Polyangiaceae bacterium]MDW8250222.1 hypothetical protein [Myxococcales bacterium]